MPYFSANIGTLAAFVDKGLALPISDLREATHINFSILAVGLYYNDVTQSALFARLFLLAKGVYMRYTLCC